MIEMLLAALAPVALVTFAGWWSLRWDYPAGAVVEGYETPAVAPVYAPTVRIRRPQQ